MLSLGKGAAAHSSKRVDGKVFVDCAECKLGGCRGDQSCPRGWYIDEEGVDGCDRGKPVKEVRRGLFAGRRATVK